MITCWSRKKAIENVDKGKPITKGVSVRCVRNQRADHGDPYRLVFIPIGTLGKVVESESSSDWQGVKRSTAKNATNTTKAVRIEWDAEAV